MYAIEINGLTKKYDGRAVVDTLNLSINKGELFALLGVNGAGKTTLIKMLSGLIKSTSGSAALFGKSIDTEIQEIKAFTNVSPQETAIAPNLTVWENLELIAGIYGANDSKEAVERIIKELGLDEVKNSRAKILSGGWQRRLSIAMALISNPKILFLDEPTLGLDVIARRELWHVIEKIKGDITIILTTHYLEEVEALSDRVGIMAHGKLKEIGSVDELKKKYKEEKFEEVFVKVASEEESL